MVVVGKCNLESQRQVAMAKGATLAQSLGGGCMFLNTSAKEDISVPECFFATWQEMLNSSVKNKNDHNSQHCYLS